MKMKEVIQNMFEVKVSEMAIFPLNVEQLNQNRFCRTALERKFFSD
jgi:hypothetical protein